MPKSRGKRKRIAEGIYQDAIGYEVVVSVGSGETKRSKSKRYKRGTGMRDMTGWQEIARAALRKKRRKVTTGTLAAWVRDYLKGVTAMPSYEARKADAEAWIPPFGDRDPYTLTKNELQQQMTTWHEAGVAGSTLRHRKTALKKAFEEFLDEDDPNPAAKISVTAYPEADIEPRALDLAVIDEILDVMPRSKARAMLKVMRATGHPFERQRQLVALHVQLDQKRVFLVSRKKGKGTKGKWYQLSKDGVSAYREFVGMECWNGVTKEAIYTCFLRGHAAANRLRVEQGRSLIPPCRPYDLRHSIGTEAYARMGDIRAVAELLDCTVETALRYTLGAVPRRIQTVVAALDEPPNQMAAQDGNTGKQAKNG